MLNSTETAMLLFYVLSRFSCFILHVVLNVIFAHCQTKSNALMKSLFKNVLRRISKKQSSKEDNATAFYPQCCAKVDDSARMRIKMSYDQNVKETISSLKTLANDMSSGFVTFKKFQTRRYQYNPDADATLYASRLLRAASILEFLLTDPDNKS